MKEKCSELLDLWKSHTDAIGTYVLTWMEFVTGGSVYDVIRNKLPNKQLKTFLFGMLWHTHVASQEFGFVHNDLSSGNVLTDTLTNDVYFKMADNSMAFKLPVGSFVPKVIDLGLGYIATSKASRNGVFRGTYQYQPPEWLTYTVLNNTDGTEPAENRSVAADVWAIGVHALVLISQRNVWDIRLDKKARKLLKKYHKAQKSVRNYESAIETMLLKWTEYAYNRYTDGIPYEGAIQHINKWISMVEKDKWDMKETFGDQYVELLDDRLDTMFNNDAERDELYDLLDLLLNWDPTYRDDNETGLWPLISHNYFRSLRVALDDDDNVQYNVASKEPSLNNQSDEQKATRMNTIVNYGVKIDQMCVIGCTVESAPLFCACCLRFYCSQQHADTHFHTK